MNIVLTAATATFLLTAGKELVADELDQSLSSMETQGIQIGVSLGAVYIQEDTDPALIAGIYGNYILDDMFLTGVRLDYFESEYEDDGFTEIDVRDAILTFNGKYVFTNTRATTRPFVGAGISTHRIELDTTRKNADRPRQIESTSIENRVGGDVVAGMYYSAQENLELQGSLGYRTIDQNEDLNHWGIAGGLSYIF